MAQVSALSSYSNMGIFAQPLEPVHEEDSVGAGGTWVFLFQMIRTGRDWRCWMWTRHVRGTTGFWRADAEQR